MSTERRQRTYDHRLIRLVQETGDAAIATGIGVPRSTVAGWLRRAPQVITTAPGLDTSAGELRVRVAKLEKRVDRLMAGTSGQRWSERILTTMETCAAQGRSTFQFLCQAIDVHVTGAAPPSLLPA